MDAQGAGEYPVCQMQCHAEDSVDEETEYSFAESGLACVLLFLFQFGADTRAASKQPPQLHTAGQNAVGLQKGHITCTVHPAVRLSGVWKPPCLILLHLGGLAAGPGSSNASIPLSALLVACTPVHSRKVFDSRYIPRPRIRSKWAPPQRSLVATRGGGDSFVALS